MAKIPGSLQERSHRAWGISRDPVTQREIRVRQEFRMVTHLVVKHKNLLFSITLVAVRLYHLPSFPFVWPAGWVWHVPRPAAFPNPCSQHPLASGRRRAREADEAFDTLQWQLRCSPQLQHLLRCFHLHPGFWGEVEKSLVNACVNTCEQSGGKRVDTRSPGMQSCSPAAGGARCPTRVIGLEMRGILLGTAIIIAWQQFTG